MTTWTAGAILAEAAAWVWVPPDARQVTTAEYQLIAYPGHYQQPTSVAWTSSARPAAELMGEVSAQVRAWGRDTVYWWIRDTTRPAGLEDALRGDGGELTETVQVLAFDLTDGLPEAGAVQATPAQATAAHGLDARVVRDEAGLRAHHLVSAEVWDDHRDRTPDDVRRELAELAESLASWTDFRVIVFADGQPAAAGGCTIAGPVARLWGAGTRPQFRGRGAYRALLSTRVSLAREHGATLALVKGRVETSGPILRRAGFTAYGDERCYRWPG
jgi:GNAT superfamily N-acetyltransferase